MYKEIVYYSIVLCCGMYIEQCLTTSCDTVVSCIRLNLCAMHGVCQYSLLSYKNLNIPIGLVVVQQIVYKQIVGVVLFTNCRVFGIKTYCGDVVV